MGGLAFLHRIHLTVNATYRIDKNSVLNGMFIQVAWTNNLNALNLKISGMQGECVRFKVDGDDSDISNPPSQR